MVAITLIATTSIFGQTVERSYDEIENEVWIRSPYQACSGCEFMKMSLNKYITKGGIRYYLSLSTIGSTFTLLPKGVIVLFTDGTKWIKSLEGIDSDLKDGDFEYSAFIRLTSTDLAMFKSKTIKKYRLYIYDEYVTEEQGQFFKASVSEVIATK